MGNGNEAFAINYGSVAIGTEIWANRMKVGPAADALDAKFEEFFLSSWVGGDPAIIVDVPANAPKPAAAAGRLSPPHGRDGAGTEPVKPKGQPDCPPSSPTPQGQLQTGPKATVAFYPDDPSNVYHSYLNDRVKFRVLHGGTNVLHVHHQHAHQWLRTPASTESKLLDSQTITPGDGFTLEMIYGSGNRNLTPGDSIFHCHFYPHFAAGCGRSGACTTSSSRGRSWSAATTASSGRPPARGRCPTARSPAARPSRPWCRCPRCRWPPFRPRFGSP